MRRIGEQLCTQYFECVGKFDTTWTVASIFEQQTLRDQLESLNSENTEDDFVDGNDSGEEVTNAD